MTAEAYRTTAATMRRRAAEADTPEHRDAWTAMARKWERLAEEVSFATHETEAETDGGLSRDPSRDPSGDGA